MYKTKQLNQHDLQAKLEQHGIAGRPELARLITSGNSSFSTGGETYALKGSVAASRESELAVAPSPIVTKQEPPPYESNMARLAREIREESTPAAEPVKALASVYKPTPTPAPAIKARTHTAMAKALGLSPETPPAATTRIQAQQRDARVRAIGTTVGKRSPVLARLFEGDGFDGPKGAA